MAIVTQDGRKYGIVMTVILLATADKAMIQNWNITDATIEVINYGAGAGFVIPVMNWHMALAEVIETARDGDTVLCHSESMVEFGQRAHSRICPQKKLAFVVYTQNGAQNETI